MNPKALSVCVDPVDSNNALMVNLSLIHSIPLIIVYTLVLEFSVLILDSATPTVKALAQSSTNNTVRTQAS